MRKTLAFMAALIASTSLGLGACARPHLPRFGNDTPRPKAETSTFQDIPYASWSDYEPAYRFYPGDEIEVNLPSAPELSKVVTVQPDGRISTPMVGSVMAADRTVDDLRTSLSEAYSTVLLRPYVDVTPKAAPLKVFVGGEVGAPGVYDMPGDINSLQAVIQAGGFKPGARAEQVVIIRRGPGGRAMMRTVKLRSFALRSAPTR